MPGIRSLLLLSSKPSEHPAVAIKFPKWGSGPIFDWYNGIKTNDGRAIEKIQIRKDTSGVVPHRFIIVRMRDGSTHRLDRRPNVAADQLGNIDLLKNTAVTTKDELIPSVDDTFLAEVKSTTACEVELTLDRNARKVDFKVVLSACFGILTDSSANKYTLFAHNCFFFSWTILMVVSRHYLPYRVPESAPLLERAGDVLPGLATYIVDEATDHFLEMVIDVVTIFRNRAGDTIHEGMNFIGRAAWTLPTEVLQFSWRKIFHARLHCGLRSELKKHVLAQLKDRIVPLCQAGLANDEMADRLDSQLWLDRLRPLIEPILKKEIMLVMWDSTLEAISAGYGKIDEPVLANNLMDPSLKFTLMGRNATQFYAVWGAALHGALPAAREAAHSSSGRGAVSDEEVFDLAWNAGRDAGLISAQRVVENTRHLMRHQDARARMWEAVWNIWESCWKEAHPKARKSSVDTINRIVARLIETGVQVVLGELGDSKSQAVRARILNIDKRWWPLASSEHDTTIAKLQAHLREVIKKDTLNNTAFEKVDNAMERIWEGARARLQTASDAVVTSVNAS
ncbi:hypothetical protein BDV93DRAFT_66897 [Ceratobasidium sp. AG-I]|nr:hypothetical protein BDV93DRAFT_66897 [Ceratobasidium sp. AG-I]